VAHDRFRFGSEGECRGRRATAINSPLSAHRSFYRGNLATFIHADASRIRDIHGLPMGLQRVETAKYAIVHALCKVSDKRRETGDLGEILARNHVDRRERHSCASVSRRVNSLSVSCLFSTIKIAERTECRSSTSFRYCRRARQSSKNQYARILCKKFASCPPQS